MIKKNNNNNKNNDDNNNNNNSLQIMIIIMIIIRFLYGAAVGAVILIFRDHKVGLIPRIDSKTLLLIQALQKQKTLMIIIMISLYAINVHKPRPLIGVGPS